MRFSLLAVMLFAVVSFSQEIDTSFVLDSMQYKIDSLTVELSELESGKQTARTRSEIISVQYHRTAAIKEYSSLASKVYPDNPEHARAYAQASRLLPKHERLYRIYQPRGGNAVASIEYSKQKIDLSDYE